MSHTLANLEKIVNDHNRVALDNLWAKGSKSWLFPPSLTAPPFDTASPPNNDLYASVSSSLASATIPGSTPPPGPSIGTLRSSTCTLPCLVQTSLSNAPSLATEAVFSVIDNNSQPSELPVVLCVGINYGQFKGSKGGPSHGSTTLLIHNTQMRPWVSKAFNLATGHGPPNDYHLVAANFFPWITNLRWEKVINENSIKEALLMHVCGYENPIQIISDLVDVVKPEFLVFHGANNCVPSLGTVVHRVSTWKKRVTILCDNLSYHAKWANSVVLS